MIIVMTHPDHGTHIAYTLEEAAQCEKNGWVRQEKHPVLGNMNVELPAKPKALDLRDQYIEKFGKPPHHRMSEKTIREALGESDG